MSDPGKRQPIGTFPSPYGVAVPVYPSIDPSDPESRSFDLDGTMTLMGIHDPATRARCAAAVRARMGGGGLDLSWLTEFGGAPPPRVALAPVATADAFYTGMPAVAGVREVVDAWIDRIADHHRWCDRAGHLLEMLATHVGDWDGHMPHERIALALSRMLTGVLENLGETEIDCLEASAFFILSGHAQWRESAREWLFPVRKTWWADWTAARPGYRRFVRMAGKLHTNMPGWIAGGRP